jgi:hypothetical protein
MNHSQTYAGGRSRSSELTDMDGFGWLFIHVAPIGAFGRRIAAKKGVAVTEVTEASVGIGLKCHFSGHRVTLLIVL